MSRLSKQIRAYVDDPDSTGRLHYGAWGILRRDQRRLIRQLCDECDAFEKDADELFRQINTNDLLIRGISAEQLERKKQEYLDEFAKQNGYRKAAEGKWKAYKDYFTHRQVGWICSNCSSVTQDLSNGDTDYCPHCGAVMETESEGVDDEK